MKKPSLKTLIAGLVLVAAGGASQAQEKLSVFVSVDPQAYVVERIAGDFVEVKTLLPVGASEHAYEPKPSQLADLASADIYFTIGLPFEKAFLDSIASASPPIRVADMDKHIKRVPLEDAFRHGDEFYDPHIWLSPLNLRGMATAVYRETIEILPERKLKMRRNLSAVIRELDDLSEDINKWFAPYKGRSFFVFHPAYAYFARDAGLNQVAIEADGKEPTGKGLSEAIEKARQAQVKSVFVQPQFASDSAEAVAKEIGADVESLDPLAKDVMANLRDISRKILDSFQSEKQE